MVDGVLTAVKKIVDVYTTDNGDRYFRINWRDTWEIEGNLINCDDLLEQFWKDKKCGERIKKDVKPNQCEVTRNLVKAKTSEDKNKEWKRHTTETSAKCIDLIESTNAQMQCVRCRNSNQLKVDTADCATQHEVCHTDQFSQYEYQGTKEVSTQVSPNLTDCGIQNFVSCCNRYCQYDGGEMMFEKEVSVQCSPCTVDCGVQKSIYSNNAFSQCNENIFQMETACQFSPESVSCGTQKCVSYEDKETQYEMLIDTSIIGSNSTHPHRSTDQESKEFVNDEQLFFYSTNIYPPYQNDEFSLMKSEEEIKEIDPFKREATDNKNDENVEILKTPGESATENSSKFVFLPIEDQGILDSNNANSYALPLPSNQLLQTNEGIYSVVDEKVARVPTDSVLLNHAPVSVNLSNTPLSSKRKERSKSLSRSDSIAKNSSYISKKSRAPRPSTSKHLGLHPSAVPFNYTFLRENDNSSVFTDTNFADMSSNLKCNDLLVSDPTAIISDTLTTPDSAVNTTKNKSNRRKRAASNPTFMNSSTKKRKVKASKNESESSVVTLRNEHELESLYVSPVYNPIPCIKIDKSISTSLSPRTLIDEQKVEIFPNNIPDVLDNSGSETNKEMLSKVKNINEDFICKYWK